MATRAVQRLTGGSRVSATSWARARSERASAWATVNRKILFIKGAKEIGSSASNFSRTPMGSAGARHMRRLVDGVLVFLSDCYLPVGFDQSPRPGTQLI